jgi:hypothetical protein
MSVNYPINLLVIDVDGITASITDLSDEQFFVNSLDELLVMAQKNIDEQLQVYFEDKRMVPLPSDADGRFTASPSSDMEDQLVKHWAFVAECRRQSALISKDPLEQEILEWMQAVIVDANDFFE